MTGPWLNIIGIGEDGIDGLSSAAKTIISDAEIFIGGARHLSMLAEDDERQKIPWPSPLSAIIEQLKTLRGSRVCVLATGDPFCFGIGSTLARSFEISEINTIPAPSAFALACARLGWARHQTECLTLHGRPLDLLHGFIAPDAKLLVLSDNGTTPGEIASRLRARGFGASTISVFEHMGGPRERRFDLLADQVAEQRFADFNTVAVRLVAGPEAIWQPQCPGLPDQAFSHDGTMTKQEVRAITLSALAPVQGQTLWDVGAGCGSIAVEWMRASRQGKAIAIEEKAERRQYIAENASALGTPNIEIVAGQAPDALCGLPPPNAVFIGGGLSHEGTVEACWTALKPGGRLVANSVTLDGERHLHEWRERLGGEMRRIEISRAEPLGKFEAWRPLAPITQWQIGKPWSIPA